MDDTRKIVTKYQPKALKYFTKSKIKLSSNINLIVLFYFFFCKFATQQQVFISRFRNCKIFHLICIYFNLFSSKTIILIPERLPPKIAYAFEIKIILLHFHYTASVSQLSAGTNHDFEKVSNNLSSKNISLRRKLRNFRRYTHVSSLGILRSTPLQPNLHTNCKTK